MLNGHARLAASPAASDNARLALPPQQTSMPKLKITARRSPIHGNGVFATDTIEKGERIVRYLGTLRTHDEVDAEYGELEEDGHTFLFTLNDEYVIDANAAATSRAGSTTLQAQLRGGVERTRGPPRPRQDLHEPRAASGGERSSLHYGIRLDEPHTRRRRSCGAAAAGRELHRTMLQPSAEDRGSRGHGCRSRSSAETMRQAAGRRHCRCAGYIAPPAPAPPPPAGGHRHRDFDPGRVAIGQQGRFAGWATTPVAPAKPVELFRLWPLLRPPSDHSA